MRFKRSKFGVRQDSLSKIARTVNGKLCASQGEALRYRELILLESQNAISNLKYQVRFPLIVNGEKITTYIADFTYNVPHHIDLVVEDFKGFQTPEFKLKWKLLKVLHPQGFQFVLSGRGAKSLRH